MVSIGLQGGEIIYNVVAVELISQSLSATKKTNWIKILYRQHDLATVSKTSGGPRTITTFSETCIVKTSSGSAPMPQYDLRPLVA